MTSIVNFPSLRLVEFVAAKEVFQPLCFDMCSCQGEPGPRLRHIQICVQSEEGLGDGTLHSHLLSAIITKDLAAAATIFSCV